MRKVIAFVAISLFLISTPLAARADDADVYKALETAAADKTEKSRFRLIVQIVAHRDLLRHCVLCHAVEKIIALIPCKLFEIILCLLSLLFYFDDLRDKRNSPIGTHLADKVPIVVGFHTAYPVVQMRRRERKGKGSSKPLQAEQKRRRVSSA